MLGSRQPTEVITGLGLDNSTEGLGTPDKTNTPMVIARRRVRRRSTFSAVLQIYGNRPIKDELAVAVVEPASRARGVILNHGANQLVLISSYMPGAVTWQDVTFEGKALFVYGSKRKSPRVVLAEGVRLTWGEHTWTLENAGCIQVEKLDRGMRVTNLSYAAAKIEVDGREVLLNPGKRWVLPLD
jgi:hypothetical protein